MATDQRRAEVEACSKKQKITQVVSSYWDAAARQSEQRRCSVEILADKVCMDTLEYSVKEASRGFNSNMDEYEKLIKVNQGKEPIICVQSPEEASLLMSKVHDTKSSDVLYISTVTSNLNAKRNLLRIERRKNKRYAAVITDPISNKEVWLGTFDTVEEVSEAYLSKKSEFDKLSKGNMENKPKKCDQIQPESPIGALLSVDQTSSVASVGSKQTIDSHNTTHFVGVRKRNSGRYTSEIYDCTSKKMLYLGTFDTAEEASQAFQYKKLEIQKLVKAKQQCNRHTHSSARAEQDGQGKLIKVCGASLSVDNDQTLDVASVGRNETTNSHKTTHIVGVSKIKSGKYVSEIRNPISKTRIWLGTFVTAEEASQVYQSKKLEFQKLVKAKQQNSKTLSCAREKKDEREKLVHVKQGHETVDREGFHLESACGASSSEINVTMSDSSNGGRDQMINSHKISHSMGVQKRKWGEYTSEILLGTLGTDEEAFSPYQCKKFGFQRSKKAELQSDMPTDSSAGENQEGEEDEDLWKGQWVQLPGDNKEVKISLRLGVPIIDNYGSLLGKVFQPESPVGASLSVDNDQTLNVASVGRNKTTCSHKTTHIVGVRKIKSKEGYETVDREGFQLESACGASSSEIDVTMSDSSNGGRDQMIDSHKISHSMGVQKRKWGEYTSEILLGTLGTAEEVFNPYQCKKSDFQRSKKAELQSDMPTDSSAGANQEGGGDGDLWIGQWVQLPGDSKEVKISLKNWAYQSLITMDLF